MVDNGPENIRLLPFGGLGEIGMNMLALEYAGKIMIVDCGLMFPEAYMFGIDLVLPDVSLLESRQTDIVGLVLTHGHEDHIGAIPFLWQQLGEPQIYGTKLTLGLLHSKLKEFELDQKAELITIKPRQEISLGPFTIEPFRVAHSIVDGVGLAIKTEIGSIIHTGDFKIDQNPVDGQRTDLARLAELGKKGSCCCWQIRPMSKMKATHCQKERSGKLWKN